MQQVYNKYNVELLILIPQSYGKGTIKRCYISMSVYRYIHLHVRCELIVVNYIEAHNLHIGLSITSSEAHLRQISLLRRAVDDISAKAV